MAVPSLPYFTFNPRETMFGLGTTELIVILVIVLIVFGVGKLPDIGGMARR